MSDNTNKPYAIQLLEEAKLQIITRVTENNSKLDQLKKTSDSIVNQQFAFKGQLTLIDELHAKLVEAETKTNQENK